MMFLYEARARARASYRNISCTTGTHFCLDWEQKGSKTQEKPSKMTLDTDHVLAHNCISLVFTATNTAHSVYFERFVGVYSAS